MISWHEASTVATADHRKAYLRRAYEDGFSDGKTGRVRGTASYFTAQDEEAIAAYRRGLRIGRRERERNT